MLLLVPSSFLDISVISEEDPYAVALACACTPAGRSTVHSAEVVWSLPENFGCESPSATHMGMEGVGFGWPFPYYSHLHVLLLRAALPPVT